MRSIITTACLVITLTGCSTTRSMWERETSSDRIQDIVRSEDLTTVIMDGTQADYLTPYSQEWDPILAAATAASDQNTEMIHKPLRIYSFTANKDGNTIEYHFTYGDPNAYARNPNAYARNKVSGTATVDPTKSTLPIRDRNSFKDLPGNAIRHAPFYSFTMNISHKHSALGAAWRLALTPATLVIDSAVYTGAGTGIVVTAPIWMPVIAIALRGMTFG